MTLRDRAFEGVRSFSRFLAAEPPQKEQRELYLNRAGEVFAEGAALPLGAIDLGADAEELWNFLKGEGSDLLTAYGVPSLAHNKTLDVLSVTAMRRASVFIFPGWFGGRFDEDRCKQYRSWLSQLEQF